MRHLTARDVKIVTVNLADAGFISEMFRLPQVIAMMEDLFEEEFVLPRFLGDYPCGTPAECRVVNELIEGWEAGMEGNPGNRFVSNLNTESYYVVFFTNMG